MYDRTLDVLLLFILYNSILYFNSPLVLLVFECLFAVSVSVDVFLKIKKKKRRKKTSKRSSFYIPCTSKEGQRNHQLPSIYAHTVPIVREKQKEENKCYISISIIFFDNLKLRKDKSNQIKSLSRW